MNAMVRFCLFYLFVGIFLLGVRSEDCCSQLYGDTPKITTPLTVKDGVITFDDLGLSGWTIQPDSMEVWTNGSQTVTLSGYGCMIKLNALNALNVTWDGTKPWYNETTNPNYYLYGEECLLDFSTPIYAISMRSSGVNITEPYPKPPILLIYNASKEEISCTNIPVVPLLNRFMYNGIHSTEPIYRVALRNFFGDNIEFSTCQIGFKKNESDECVDINECEQLDSCDPRATCQNLPGSFNCTCPDGFSGDGVGPEGCQDVNECETSPCSLNATCSNQEGAFTCQCDDGYEGDGLGQDGCTLVLTPVTAPVQSTAPVRTSTPVDRTAHVSQSSLVAREWIAITVAAGLVILLAF